MAITKQKKEMLLEQTAKDLEASQSVVYVDLKGMTVEEIESIRKKLRAENAKCRILKKRLIDIALKKTFGSTDNIKALDGNIGLIFSYDEPAVGPKIIQEACKEYSKGTVYGGILHKEFIDAVKMQKLATLPSRNVLLAQFMGTCKAPVQNFCSASSQIIGGFVRVLKAIEEQKSQNS
jgi:large subunit ribosomal protein L10